MPHAVGSDVVCGVFDVQFGIVELLMFIFFDLEFLLQNISSHRQKISVPASQQHCFWYAKE